MPTLHIYLCTVYTLSLQELRWALREWDPHKLWLREVTHMVSVKLGFESTAVCWIMRPGFFSAYPQVRLSWC